MNYLKIRVHAKRLAYLIDAINYALSFRQNDSHTWNGPMSWKFHEIGRNVDIKMSELMAIQTFA